MIAPRWGLDMSITFCKAACSVYKALKQFVVWSYGQFHIWIVSDPPLVVKCIDDDVQIFFRKM